MKYITILVLLLFLTSGILPGQDLTADSHCATVEYNRNLEEINPGIKAKRESIEKEIQQFIAVKSGDSVGIVVIPTVVHVLWNTPEQNIPDDQVWSQIFVLNDDFRRRNADTVLTPVMFKPAAADCKIEFCLAKRAPGDTAATYGIHRVYTDVTEFGIDNQVKNPYEGGCRAWDAKQYLNIWVCNLAGNFLGYAQYPGGPDSTDGVVVDYKCFGSVGDLNPHYNKGRTATHEIGHWLDLWHIWGDDFGSCDGTDYVDDTPNAADANYYCPSHPHTTNCNTTGEMFMNYMDYCDDVCFNIFTNGQRDRMMASISATRPELLTSEGCVPYDAIEEVNQTLTLNLFPNPVTQEFTLQANLPHPETFTITIIDIIGNEVFKHITAKQTQLNLPVPVSNLNDGMYFLKVRAGNLHGTAKIFVLH
jgi:hypothetical protein